MIESVRLLHDRLGELGLPCTSCRSAFHSIYIHSCVHRLIKDFEREARTDGMPARELADRKRKLVNEVNSYIALKKGYSSTESSRGELLSGAAEEAGGPNNYDGKQ